MDSLLANYASSDDEVEEEQQPPAKRTAFESESGSGNSIAHSTSSFFSSLPQPKSSSPFQSLPLPKQTLPNPLTSKAKPLLDDDGEEPYSKPSSRSSGTAPKSSPLFSKLPEPKSQFPQKPSSILSTSEPNTKRVVQFTPPVNPFALKSSELDDDDDDEDDEQEKERRRRNEPDPLETKSVTSFLSTIPAPKNSSTLGVLPTSGSGRRAIVETQVSAWNSGGSAAENDSEVEQNSGRYANYDNSANYGRNDGNQNAGQDASFANYGNRNPNFDQNVGVSGQMGSETGVADTSNYGNYEGYGSYVDCGQSTNSAADGSEVSIMDEIELRVNGKRGRNKIPTEIVEVKQDELMKNRPREDQVKSTGIAFGPAYQPASTKGKPSKLHKRKHQISSLYFDMRQKETELAERRSRGFLTKAETQAKYGW